MRADRRTQVEAIKLATPRLTMAPVVTWCQHRTASTDRNTNSLAELLVDDEHEQMLNDPVDDNEEDGNDPNDPTIPEDSSPLKFRVGLLQFERRLQRRQGRHTSERKALAVQQE